MRTKIKVGVLMGGKSAEHDISLISGQEVVKALDKSKKYSPIPIKISKAGKFDINKLNDIEVAFIVLHGPYGEDGKIQGLLETLGIKYTGPGVLASSIGMDKILFRDILKANNIKLPEYLVAEKISDLDNIKIKFPLFIKPADQGSSVGTSIANNKAELIKAFKLAQKYSHKVLVDEYIKGDEYTCAVMGNDKLIALPIVHIKPLKSSFFDYDSKYTSGGAEEIVPADINKVLENEIKKTSLKIYKILGCRGFSRIDFLVDSKTKIAYVLEINTIPGLTPMSLFPKSAKAAGMSYLQLIEKIIEYAS